MKWKYQHSSEEYDKIQSVYNLIFTMSIQNYPTCRVREMWTILKENTMNRCQPQDKKKKLELSLKDFKRANQTVPNEVRDNVITVSEKIGHVSRGIENIF